MTKQVENQKVVDQAEDDLPNMSRRSFFKRTVVGGGAAMLAGGAALGASKVSLEGSTDTPGIEVDETIFKPKDQRDVMLCHATSPYLSKIRNPERSEQYARLWKKILTSMMLSRYTNIAITLITTSRVTVRLTALSVTPPGIR